jgi:uncharacterized protein
MIKLVVTSVVGFCARHPWPVSVAGLLLAMAAGAFDVTRFSINTDTENLIANDLPWRQRQSDFNRAFPQKDILVVVTAPTPEAAEQAAGLLEGRLIGHSDLFKSVVRPESGTFFQNNGLLFEPLAEVTQSMAGLSKANVLIDTLAGDPSLRGALTALNLAVDGVARGLVNLDQLVWPLTLTGQTLTDVLAGKRAVFSWQALVQGGPSNPDQLRRFIEVQPVLDFSALQPGRRATNGIQQAAADLKLAEAYGAVVQLTGKVPMDDDQFSIIRKSASRDTLTALFGTLFILWLALRSWKIVVAVAFGVLVGLAATTALGLALVGSFNLLSIAFFVLFVGLGVDFGIQFSVRYRSERHDCDDLHGALARAAGDVAVPLTLAAAATAVAFFSFLPTSYRGLSELGLIAGCGMLIAFLCSVTLVPAVLALLAPSGEALPVGFERLAPLDDFLQRHRVAVIAGTLVVVFAGAPLLRHIPFDFNPINLQDPNAPSVVAYRELQGNPLTSGNDADIIAGSLADAAAIAKRLAGMPQVSRTLTLNSFIPDDQAPKLAAIRAAAADLRDSLDEKPEPAASETPTIDAIRATAANLLKVGNGAAGPGADGAHRVSSLLTQLAQADAETRLRAENAVAPSLIHDLGRLRRSLDPTAVTQQDLPASLVRDWLLPDGRARVQVLPKEGSGDDAVLRAFATAVLAEEPSATGPAVSLYESARTVIAAFAEAGAIALVAIALLLLLALRRVTDVLLTLIPLLLAGVVTLEICVVTKTVINFANIIALPLLLGVGVAFKIYYILAWREGLTHLLESALTRAVIFSALTNAVAFGSMWSSNDPGLSSMGELMALALVCTMAAAVLFQPVLMGTPRQLKAVPLTVDLRPEVAE